MSSIRCCAREIFSAVLPPVHVAPPLCHPQGPHTGLSVPTELPLLRTSLSHFRGLQNPSYNVVSLDHHLKLALTLCVEATEVQGRCGACPRSPSWEGHPPFHCGSVHGSGRGSTRWVFLPPEDSGYRTDHRPCTWQVGVHGVPAECVDILVWL